MPSRVQKNKYIFFIFISVLLHFICIELGMVDCIVFEQETILFSSTVVKDIDYTAKQSKYFGWFWKIIPVKEPQII